MNLSQGEKGDLFDAMCWAIQVKKGGFIAYHPTKHHVNPIDSNDIDFEDILKLINSELIDREKLHKQTRKDKKTIESLERQILGLRQIVGGVP